MRNTDLNLLVEDVERVARAAQQLLDAAKQPATSAATAPEDGAQNMLQRIGGAPRSARNYVRSKPWRTLGIATGIGFLVGCMLTRRPTGRDRVQR